MDVLEGRGQTSCYWLIGIGQIVSSILDTRHSQSQDVCCNPHWGGSLKDLHPRVATDDAVPQ